ncbi:efflux transporter periplasmic adaptor subunit [Hahella sp. CCB-MM4]|uniref:efflux RND transporter periplasmic adaptor subunit n=1 Tax=Hahella sp. (strain CCB-MM4) TaxID=1926491 RepID=UPI000B9A4955|nr:efflux RND transporter periplasmic adaptor subunit [Hahella sp. CCB-MM4]OZG69796.1 efflux transporter periplasmic adaptor subunit [Hahella sp. CCB-MM4]
MISRIPTYWVALGIVIVITVWVASGAVESAKTTAPETEGSQSEQLPKVAYKTIEATEVSRTITVQGQVEPWRELVLESRLDSYVEAVHVATGERVKKGDLLITLSQEDLPAQMAEAKAQAAVAKSELVAAQSLFKRGLLADTELKVKEASVATAEASVARLNQKLENTIVRAPFDGVIEDRRVEVGATVQNGTELLQIVDDSKLKLVGQVPQQYVLQLSFGDDVMAKLINGAEIRGRVSFIGYQASIATRTYRVEAELDNPERKRLAGATATLEIGLGEVEAHVISPALLRLDEKGRLSVEHLSEDDRVVVTPVERVKASNTALWVSGLPHSTRLITLGKGFVSQGQQVDAVPESELTNEGID